MARPWFIRYSQATGVLLVAVAVFLIAWAVIQPMEVWNRIVVGLLAVVVATFGIRRLLFTSRASQA